MEIIAINHDLKMVLKKSLAQLSSRTPKLLYKNVKLYRETGHYSFLTKRGININKTLAWIPRPFGITSNHKADQLANKGLFCTIPVSNNIMKEDNFPQPYG